MTSIIDKRALLSKIYNARKISDEDSKQLNERRSFWGFIMAPVSFTRSTVYARVIEYMLENSGNNLTDLRKLNLENLEISGFGEWWMNGYLKEITNAIIRNDKACLHYDYQNDETIQKILVDLHDKVNGIQEASNIVVKPHGQEVELQNTAENVAVSANENVIGVKDTYAKGGDGYNKLNLILTLSAAMAKYSSLNMRNKANGLNKSNILIFEESVLTKEQIENFESDELPASYFRDQEIIGATNEFNVSASNRILKHVDSLPANPKILHINAQKSHKNIKFKDANKSIEIPISDVKGAAAEINEVTAVEIFEAIENGKYDVLIVNCSGGMSRSAAINFALAYIYGNISLDEIKDKVQQQSAEGNKLIQCNPYTFNSLVSAANQRYQLNLELIHEKEYRIYRAF